MQFKTFLISAFALALLVFSGCNSDDEMVSTNTVTISILEPTDGSVVSDASMVHIHITLEATEENHEYEIVLHPEGDTADKIIDLDAHDHDKEITFEQGIDLSSYPSGTEFHLEVEACADHDCAELETASIQFSIP
ncbi:MAG: hypothetical protein KDC44_18545 [Phaeodactylibacter sp.]|nr:hypothetical protein [Phaeodactylibacter sp.]